VIGGTPENPSFVRWITPDLAPARMSAPHRDGVSNNFPDSPAMPDRGKIARRGKIAHKAFRLTLHFPSTR
jgi:hypothetical protein